MKLLVFSDSHSNIDNMVSVIEACKYDTSLIVHLGDMSSDFKRIVSMYPDIPNVFIKGNNDFFDVDTDQEFIGEFAGVKCLFTHGHQYSVKSGIMGISVRARALRSELVLFGHTHMPYKEKRGNTLFFNPGSIGQRGTPTFGIIHIDNCTILSADVLSFDPISKTIDFVRNYR